MFVIIGENEKHIINVCTTSIRFGIDKKGRMKNATLSVNNIFIQQAYQIAFK